MSTVKANRIQIGQDADPNKNFTLRVPVVPDGTLEIRRSNADAPGALLVKINADGGLNTGGPAFSAFSSVATSMPLGAMVKIGFQIEEYDTGNCYDTALSRFTPNVAGYYQFVARFELGPTATDILIQFYKNGAFAKAGPNTLNGYTCSICATIYLNGTTDYVELMGRQSAATQSTFAGNPGAQGYSYFQGHLVRAA